MNKPRDIVRLRRWCVRRLLEGWPAVKVSGHAQVPLRSIYRWWSRSQAKGWRGLIDGSRRPHRIHRIPQETIVKVIEVRIREGWCSEAIEAYLKAHEIGVKTFASIEPWIPDVTYPQLIIEKLRDFVDRFIIGSMHYHRVPRAFYAERLLGLIAWLNENKVNYYLKKELRSCLPSEEYSAK